MSIERTIYKYNNISTNVVAIRQFLSIYLVGIVLAVHSATAICVERRQNLNGSATGLQTWTTLTVACGQESGENALVRVGPKGARWLVGEVSLVLANLTLSAVGWLGGAVFERVVRSRK